MKTIMGLLITTMLSINGQDAARELSDLLTQTDLALAQRKLKCADGVYIVEYLYNTAWATVPAVRGGKVHYDAKIMVYKVEKKKRTQVGASFSGKYTMEGCFEDDPEALVRYALKHKDDPPAKEKR